MKIIDLEINCFRGIVNLKLTFKKNNALVFGDNGTGKSGVVDAIDFLIKGEISRLQGIGSLSLKEHGKHVACDISEAWVKATVKLPQYDELISIERSLSNPTDLIVQTKYKSDFDEIRELSKSKPHYLSRREILDFINTTEGDRAKEIEKILNLKHLDDNRTILMQLEKSIEKKYDVEHIKETNFIDRISQIVEIGESEWINVINELRFTFCASKISDINEELISDINFSDQGKSKVVLKTAIATIANIIDDILNESHGLVVNLRKYFDIKKKLEKIIALEESENIIKLLETGLLLIKDEHCPLCKSDLDKNSFLTDVTSRLEGLKEVKKITVERNSLNTQIKTAINNCKAKINNLSSIVTYDKNDITGKLQVILEFYNNDLKNIDFNSYEEKLTLLKELNFDELSNVLERKLIELEANKADIDYKKLSTISVLVKDLLETRKTATQLEKVKHKCLILHKTYIESQKEFLNKLYESIQYRFTSLYREMHNEDESGFFGTFHRKKAGLGLNVSFYDGKEYPPNAVHSEGHQDSMGICLFLALSERISNSKINTIVLDDVVMSIDIHHRQSFCDVLIEEFPNKQFIITTHDFIWRKELEQRKVVQRENIIHFKNWNIDHGPFVETGKDIWDAINMKLDNGDKNEGIAALRFYLEDFFGDICNKYRLKVPYSVDARWTLEDVFNPSSIFYKNAFKLTVTSATSFQKDSTKQQYLVDRLDNAYNKLNTDRWALNPTVHFTPWAQALSLDELKQLVKVFKEYCDVLSCSLCNSKIEVNMNYSDCLSTQCNCGENNFSCLRKK